jgi:hypothetical protein
MDTESFEWREIYDQVRGEASTAEIEVLDQRQGFHLDEVDLLISLHSADSIASDSPPGNADSAMKSIRNRHIDSELLHVGIAAVGRRCFDAEKSLKELVEPVGHSSSFYICGVANGDELREILYRWLRMIVEARASRQKTSRSANDNLIPGKPSSLEEDR